MSKKFNTEMKKPDAQNINAPNSAVPNRAHTEMKSKNSNENKNNLNNCKKN